LLTDSDEQRYNQIIRKMADKLHDELVCWQIYRTSISGKEPKQNLFAGA